MSQVDELHARLEAVVARGCDTEQRYAAIMARHDAQQREDATEAEATQRFVLGLIEIAQVVAARASTNARNVATNRRCRECGVVGPEPLEHELGCLAAQARALLATLQPPAQQPNEGE